MPLSVAVTNIQLAHRFAEQGQPFDAIVSVLPWSETGGRFPMPVPPPGCAHHVIEMSDAGCGKLWSEEECARAVGDGLILPDDALVGRLIGVLEEALAASRERDFRLLIHCHGGVSRSVAAALILAALVDGPGKEAASIERLKRVVDDETPVPNHNIVAIADRLMGRNGRLYAALEAHVAWVRSQPQPDWP